MNFLAVAVPNSGMNACRPASGVRAGKDQPSTMEKSGIRDSPTDATFRVSPDDILADAVLGEPIGIYAFPAR